MSRGQFRDLVLSGDRRRSSFSGSGIFPEADNTFFFQLGKFSQLSPDKARFDDDIFDRINYKYSALLILMSIGLLTIRQNVGKPIQCWVPQEFTQGWEEYTENYCWVSNTYFQEYQEHQVRTRLILKSDKSEVHNYEIRYYQWVPILLAIQSALFSWPCVLWRWLSGRSGLDLQRILRLMHDGVHAGPDDEEAPKTTTSNQAATSGSSDDMAASKSLPQLTRMLHSLMTRQRSSINNPVLQSNGEWGLPTKKATNSRPQRQKIAKFNLCCNKTHPDDENNDNEGLERDIDDAQLRFLKHHKKTHGKVKECLLKLICKQNFSSNSRSLMMKESTISMGYVFTKFVYVVNVFGQLFIMKKVIGNDNWLFGWKTLVDLLQKRYWIQSGNFPRVSFCDIEAKKLGKNYKYTIQCVLPMNMFIEKIYTFLWFWFVLMLIMNIGSLFLWLRRLFLCGRGGYGSSISLVTRYLRYSGKLPLSRSPIRKFVRTFLMRDLIFLIYLIKINIGDMVASGVVEQLWSIYYRQSDAKDVDDIKFSNYFLTETRASGCGRGGPGRGMGSRVPSLMINDELFNPSSDNRSE